LKVFFFITYKGQVLKGGVVKKRLRTTALNQRVAEFRLMISYSCYRTIPGLCRSSVVYGFFWCCKLLRKFSGFPFYPIHFYRTGRGSHCPHLACLSGFM